jgi:hypothetical protein
MPLTASASPRAIDAPRSLCNRNSRGDFFSGRFSSVTCISDSFFFLISSRSRSFCTFQPRGKAIVSFMPA